MASVEGMQKHEEAVKHTVQISNDIDSVHDKPPLVHHVIALLNRIRGHHGNPKLLLCSTSLREAQTHKAIPARHEESPVPHMIFIITCD